MFKRLHEIRPSSLGLLLEVNLAREGRRFGVGVSLSPSSLWYKTRLLTLRFFLFFFSLSSVEVVALTLCTTRKRAPKSASADRERVTTLYLLSGRLARSLASSSLSSSISSSAVVLDGLLGAHLLDESDRANGRGVRRSVSEVVVSGEREL